MNLVGLCGSVRARSFNRFALRLAAEQLPPGATLDVLPWRELPVFDADVLAQGEPAPVSALKRRIRAADGVVIATPEYNFTLPGAFKNALDWLSRGEDQPFKGKPVAILSAATGPLGGARVQYDLRRVLLFLDAEVLRKPEVFIGMAASKFDADGNCSDDTTRRFVGEQMRAFAQWISNSQPQGLP